MLEPSQVEVTSELLDSYHILLCVSYRSVDFRVAEPKMTRNKWPENAWKCSSKYSRSTIPFGSSNPMRQGPTNVPRTEPLSGVGSLTLRSPVESPWTRSVERRQSNSMSKLNICWREVVIETYWGPYEHLWWRAWAWCSITGERVFGGGSPRLFGDVWLSVYPRLISSPTTNY